MLVLQQGQIRQQACVKVHAGLGVQLTALQLPRALQASGARQFTSRCIPGLVSLPCHPNVDPRVNHLVEESCLDVFMKQVLYAVNHVQVAERQPLLYNKPGNKIEPGGSPDFTADVMVAGNCTDTVVVGEAKASARYAQRMITQILVSQMLQGWGWIICRRVVGCTGHVAC